MEQYKIVRSGNQEFFIDSTGTWFLRIPSNLGAIRPNIAFGLPIQFDIRKPPVPPRSIYPKELVRPRGTKPNERFLDVEPTQDRGQDQIELQELGKPKVDFLQNIAKSLQNVGNAIGDFKKIARPQADSRAVISQAASQEPNPQPSNKLTDFFNKFSTTQKAAGAGAILLLVGVAMNKGKSPV